MLPSSMGQRNNNLRVHQQNPFFCQFLDQLIDYGRYALRVKPISTAPEQAEPSRALQTAGYSFLSAAHKGTNLGWTQQARKCKNRANEANLALLVPPSRGLTSGGVSRARSPVAS